MNGPQTGPLTGAVVAVGTELLLGDVVNTNAAWLGGRLAAAGLEVVSSCAVGDVVAAIAEALRRGLAVADVVITTGGLGPTSDDVTREALALVAGAPLARQPVLEQGLRDRFAGYGYPMPDQVLRQADVPRGARVLRNPVGSAPGLELEVGGRLLVAAPGPPHELRAVLEDSAAGPSVLDRLAARSGRAVVTRTLHVSGVGESAVAERVEGALDLPPGVALAYLAGAGVVRVRFTTAGDPAVLEPLVAACAALLGADVWGYDDATLPGVVSDLLRAAAATVAVAESVTGGLLAAALTGLAGSSDVLRGGVVAYATDLKTTLAGVEPAQLAGHGAVAPETALAMAAGARTRLGATYGVSTTGVAGPAEQEGRPVGTVHVAVSGPAGAEVRSLRLVGDRDRVRLLTVTAALDLLRRTLRRDLTGVSP